MSCFQSHLVLILFLVDFFNYKCNYKKICDNEILMKNSIWFQIFNDRCPKNRNKYILILSFILFFSSLAFLCQKMAMVPEIDRSLAPIIDHLRNFPFNLAAFNLKGSLMNSELQNKFLHHHFLHCIKKWKKTLFFNY